MGYRQFPFMVGRWEVNSSYDVYGYGPMHRVLPDVKQLQHTEEQKLNLLDKIVSPPLNHPASLRADFPSIMAGALNAVPDQGGAKVEPTYAPDVRAYELASNQCAVLEQRIRLGLHEDLWRMLSAPSAEDQRPPGMTATEVMARHEEKLILLGPTVDRFHNDVLGPLIRRVIAILADRRILPPPPRELVEALSRGEDVRIEYISVLAQAQRLLGLGSMERLISVVSALAGADPNHPVWDKVDRDEFTDQAADSLGIPPSVVRSDDDVAAMRIARAQAQQRAQQAQDMLAQATAAQRFSQAQPQNAPIAPLLGPYGPAATGALPADLSP